MEGFHSILKPLVMGTSVGKVDEWIEDEWLLGLIRSLYTLSDGVVSFVRLLFDWAGNRLELVLIESNDKTTRTKWACGKPAQNVY